MVEKSSYQKMAEILAKRKKKMAEIVVFICSSKTAECLVDPVMHQVGLMFRFMFCLAEIVDNLKKQKEIVALAPQCLQNEVESGRRNGEEIENDEDANRTLADVQSLESEIQECNKCDNHCPCWGCCFWFIWKLEKRALSVIKQPKTCKFELVGHLTSLLGIVFFPLGDFVPYKSSRFVLNKIMVVLEDDVVSMIGEHGMEGVGKTTFVKEVETRVKNLEPTSSKI